MQQTQISSVETVHQRKGRHWRVVSRRNLVLFSSRKGKNKEPWFSVTIAFYQALRWHGAFSYWKLLPPPGGDADKWPRATLSIPCFSATRVTVLEKEEADENPRWGIKYLNSNRIQFCFPEGLSTPKLGSTAAPLFRWKTTFNRLGEKIICLETSKSSRVFKKIKILKCQTDVSKKLTKHFNAS
jgi:hypothetical protein